MLARLGNVLYWLGCIVAGLIMVFGFYYMEAVANGSTTVLPVFAVIAFAVWLVGRACRYVLAET